jgi:hypothetical protein
VLFFIEVVTPGWFSYDLLSLAHCPNVTCSFDPRRTNYAVTLMIFDVVQVLTDCRAVYYLLFSSCLYLNHLSRDDARTLAFCSVRHIGRRTMKSDVAS